MVCIFSVGESKFLLYICSFNYLFHILLQKLNLLVCIFSVGESKEFVFEVFGIKFHPHFPNLVRDECDEVCECGMYPSHMYDRVGVQLMADIEEPVSMEE